jgi:hypothetical protein
MLPEKCNPTLREVQVGAQNIILQSISKYLSPSPIPILRERKKKILCVNLNENKWMTESKYFGSSNIQYPQTI